MNSAAFKILIVEDDATQRMLLRECLEVAGFSCEEAENGKDGLEKCRALAPTLVILDVLMPDIDGFEVCSEIRSDPETMNIPVLMITGLEDHESIEKAYDVGATNFFTKPINCTLLPHHVKYMVRSSEMAREIRKAKQAMKEANEAKSRFLANMSHELRTPLNSIIGFSEIIQNETMGPVGNQDYAEFAKEIHDSGSHLLNLINDILDLSKIDSGDLAINKDYCDVQGLVHSTIRSIDHQATEAGLILDLEISEEVQYVYTDARRLKQILVNILSNSIKFTPQGGKIGFHVKKISEGAIEFKISDTGIGIPASEIERSLSRFHQIDGSFTKNKQGTGLGLPLSKDLTEHLDGSFVLTSEVGVGTTVEITLPGAGRENIEHRLAS